VLWNEEVEEMLDVKRNLIWQDKFINFSLKYVSFYLLLVIVIFGTIVSDVFLTGQNIMNILKQISVNGILACGFTFVLLSGGFDLSLGANTSLCCCLVIGFQNGGMNMYFAILLVILVGMLVGLINATIMRFIRAELSDIFMVTMGTTMLVFSVALTYTQGYELYVNNTDFTAIGMGSLFGVVPYPVLILAVLMVIAQTILLKTSLGRKLYFTGGSKTASFHAGIKVPNVRTFAFIASGFAAALAAVVMTSRTTGANSHCANGYEFDACVAAIIGGIALGGGKGDMRHTLIGVLIMGIMVNIMNLTGIPSVVQMIIKGIMLIIMIYVGILQQRPRQMRVIREIKIKGDV
jgi:ribose/xylose/arabinose/galactoside ABC-type transport system permease subunit